MRLDDLLQNPVVKRAVAAGEEHAGKVVTRLLANETAMRGLQGLLGAAAAARSTFEAGVQRALQAANLPSAADLGALKQKLGELEALIDDLHARLDAAPAVSAAPTAERAATPDPLAEDDPGEGDAGGEGGGGATGSAEGVDDGNGGRSA